ncbi:MAG: cysteine dioxygenase [Pigmentiphaga sp.]|nr:cysteine dioxygenase [Pigmentiphaga sp.]
MSLQRLQSYLSTVQAICAAPAGLPGDHLHRIADALRQLLRHDDWLPDAYAQPHPDHYQQYPLYIDPAGRFSVVSFVWGPGQLTPLHDHQTWGVVGVLRGAELSEPFTLRPGLPPAASGPAHTLMPGDVELIANGADVHRVSNALANQVSISIHTYGSNIGQQQRHVFDPQHGAAKPFVSGYALPPLLDSLPA